MTSHSHQRSRRMLLAGLAAAGLCPKVFAQVSRGASTAAPVTVAVPGNLYSRLEGGRPAGIFLETTELLLQDLARSASYLSMPMDDAYAALETGAVGVATVVVPSTRVSQVAWLSAPLFNEFNMVVALKDNELALSRIADLRGKRVAGRAGFSYPLLEQDPSIRLERHATDGEMLRTLLFGEADVAIISGISDIYTFRSEGIMRRLQLLPVAVGTVPMVAALSKAVFNAVDVAAFDLALARLKQGTRWQQILERNGLADLVREWPLLPS